MKKAAFAIVCFLFSAMGNAQAVDGLVQLQSPYAPGKTMDRLEAVVTERGLNVFARIDHKAGAEQVGEALKPTELLIFGNPQGGTPFMQCAQSVGIDLPLKALVWEDAQGTIWLGYNDPAFIAARHGVADCEVVGRLQQALEGIVEATVSP